MKKIIIILLTLFIGIFTISCQSSDNGEEKSQDSLKVAVALTGPKTDGGWNQSAYEGLVKMEEDLGATISYHENTQASDYERVLRDYAKDGNDVVIGHGAQFSDAIQIVADEYPDTMFLVTSTNVTNNENLGSINNNYLQAGFLQGAFAALMSESNVVGGIGGMAIPPITNDILGFEAGAKYINPDITILTSVIGSFDDSNKAKETALAFIAQGADILMVDANNAARGVYAATQEKGLYAIASISPEYEDYPETLISCATADMATALFNTVKEIQDGTYEAEYTLASVSDGIIDFTYNPALEDKIPEDVLTKMAELKKQLNDEEIDVSELVEN